MRILDPVEWINIVPRFLGDNSACVSVCVCVYERYRERERDRHTHAQSIYDLFKLNLDEFVELIRERSLNTIVVRLFLLCYSFYIDETIDDTAALFRGSVMPPHPAYLSTVNIRDSGRVIFYSEYDH